MSRGDCAIVIVTFNGWNVVRQCLEALEPEIQPGVTVTIIDNGSSDGLPDNIRATFGWAELIETGRNLGFAAGNNLGISRTSSEFVILLNSDAIIRPGFVPRLLMPFDSSPRVGSVAGTMVFRSDPTVIASAGIDVFANGLALDRSLGESLGPISAEEPIFGPSAGAAAYRRSALEDAGLFPEAFFMYLEDVDLAWRLRLNGWESLVSSGAIVEHAYSALAVEGSVFKRRLLARNRLWYMTRCFPSWLLARNWWRMVSYDLLVAGSALARRDGASLRGRIDALVGLRARLEERSRIQTAAHASRAEIEAWIRPSPSPRDMMRLRDLTRRLASASDH